MLRILTCLTTEHDWRLVLIAGLVCFFASIAAVNLFHRARQTQRRARVIWLVTAGPRPRGGARAAPLLAPLAAEPRRRTSAPRTPSGLLLAAAQPACPRGFSRA